ncbi:MULTISPECIES: glutathionylspermidine synthase family protein [Thermomonospora]|uniref:Glutathionylspermidine synthase n=1 Tax=Thermomonospora curvata (strain ATCC 19995 / DSM 43183 / JCM 3096 / KCTC 9072 / NBRC 15933 / NCIMB 10081 / Henssen B9) TaxID=471852 RepID=D1A3Z2_THECD|nr:MULTISPECIES: glutathionylspermidine synthase family protein [Thermomonospora]ACY98045.1 glutathionylspermidine synthase [Thermomonospora curvata DSM 43183]PKK14320.1 MAG: glutathionylspermidine synthase family protein [Thermomonospora sp. CIF 1]
MIRRTGPVRPDWERTIEEQGLGFHRYVAQGDDGRPYWDESAYYSFTMAEVLGLEDTVTELHRMCLNAVDHVVREGRFGDYGIPERWWEPIAESWRRRDRHLYGRFDLCYDGRSPAKLLEYNADTPTSLVESAVVQWFWKEDTHPRADQWNSLHEALIDRWRELLPSGGLLHLAYSGADETGEDALTVGYMADVAAQAGLEVELLTMEDIGSDGHAFYDLAERRIEGLFKLYPWEWIVREPFGPLAVARQPKEPWVEPLWKMLLSNKALLAILWELYPGHPNLLPAYFDGPREMTAYAVKPLLGREGASMRLVQPHEVVETPGGYGAEGHVFQQLCPLPDFDGWRPVLGAWVVGDEPAGLGIRETRGLITGDTASFVPHLIED